MELCYGSNKQMSRTNTLSYMLLCRAFGRVFYHTKALHTERSLVKTSTLLAFVSSFHSWLLFCSFMGGGAPPCLTLGHGHISSYSPGGVSPTPPFHEHFLPFGSSSPQNPHLSDSAFLWQGPPPLSSSYWGHLIPRARGRASWDRESAICIYWPSNLTSGSMSGTIRVFLVN